MVDFRSRRKDWVSVLGSLSRLRIPQVLSRYSNHLDIQDQEEERKKKKKKKKKEHVPTVVGTLRVRSRERRHHQFRSKALDLSTSVASLTVFFKTRHQRHSSLIEFSQRLFFYSSHVDEKNF